jgi:predicted ArsR family transcriptional regulator
VQVDIPKPRPDDVLVQSTRARLFALLGELKRPARTEELAERVGLHPNGVRVHLELLRSSGLVARTRVRQSVGRPRDEWAISPDARPGGDPPSAYAELGRWLARAIPPTKARLRDVEATGRQVGRELAPRGTPAETGDVIQSTLAALGFQPRRREEPGDRVVYCLDNCPYRDAVRENQPVVCTLHRGITRGLLDVLEPTARLAGFVPRDPETAGCLIELEGVPAAGSGGNLSEAPVDMTDQRQG